MATISTDCDDIESTNEIKKNCSEAVETKENNDELKGKEPTDKVKI